MTLVLAKIQGEYIRYFLPSNIVSFFGDLDVDADGAGGNVWNEPVPPWQDDTAYHYQGKALNPNEVPFIVVPPQVVSGVDPVVLGCHARVRDMRTGKKCLGLVGDIGPRSKIGEVSVAMARELGINPSPISGGEDDVCFLYECWPGVPAVVNGITYPLQPS